MKTKYACDCPGCKVENKKISNLATLFLVLALVGALFLVKFLFS